MCLLRVAIFLYISTTMLASSIIIREYENTDCSGDDFNTVADAASNTCERVGTFTSMMVTCRAGAVVVTKWETTDCDGKSVEDPIRLLSDTCTPFPMQTKALYYDCSASSQTTFARSSIIVTIVTVMLFVLR